MKYADLRDFLAQLERRGQFKRIGVDVDPRLEMTEICDRVLRAGGPALLFEKPKGYSMPVLGNLFGTPQRVALGMGEDSVASLREVGKLLAFLKEPEPPKGLKDAWQNTRPVFMQVMNMAPKERSSATLPGHRLGGRRRRPRSIADPDVLARRHCAADHLGPDGDARPREGAAESRYLPPAGDRAQQADHALAGTSRRRARFPRPRARASWHAVSDRGRLGRGPGDDSGRGDAGARLACPSISSRACCAAHAPRS